MSGRIINLNRDKLLQALAESDAKGYVLFPEIRDHRNFERIRSHPTASRMEGELLRYAGGLCREDDLKLSFPEFMEFSVNGNRLNYEKKYFESKKQLHALVMAELLQDDRRYIEAIQERLRKWCNTFSWELPAHVPLSNEAIERAGFEAADTTVALFSAETAFYFSEILSLHADRLDPKLVCRLREEIDNRVLSPFLSSSYPWEKVINNWSSVCAGAVGCAAIYSIGDSGLLCDVLLRVLDAMECFLSGFDSDGVTPEGLTYWNYGFSFFVYFSELLRERTCEEINLLAMHIKLRKIAELPLYLHFPDGHMVNFSDAPGNRWEGYYGLTCRLSDRFGIDQYRIPWDLDIFYDHTSKWAVTARNLFWGLDHTPAESAAQPEAVMQAGSMASAVSATLSGPTVPAAPVNTGMKYFPESQWLIDRRFSGDGVFCCFAAKGGHNDEAHNHNDLGHFILYCGGDMPFIDLGAPEYTKKYFGPDRYDMLHASSRGHSVPVINNAEQLPGAEHAATVTECAENAGMVRFGLDLTRAYELKELSRFHRTFNWDHSRRVLEIADSFGFNKPDNLVNEVFLTEMEPEFAEPGVFRIRGNSFDALLHYDSPAGKTEVIREEFTDHFGDSAKAYRIQIRHVIPGTDTEIKIIIKMQASVE